MLGIGLVCKDCKVEQKEIPRIEEILSIFQDSLDNRSSSEMEALVSKYPHVLPVLDRIARLRMEYLEPFLLRQNNFQNGTSYDNLGEAFGR